MRSDRAGQSRNMCGEKGRVSKRFSKILEESRADLLFPKIKTGKLPFIDFITAKMGDRSLFTKTVSAAQLICFVMRDERCLLAQAGVMYLFCQAVADAELAVSEAKLWIEVMDDVSECFGLSEAQCRLIGLIWLLDHDFRKCPRDFRDYNCADSDLWEYVLRAAAERGTEEQARKVAEAIRGLFGEDGLAKIRECVPGFVENKTAPKGLEHPAAASAGPGEKSDLAKGVPAAAGKRIGQGKGHPRAQDRNVDGVSPEQDIRDKVKAGRPLMMLLRKVRECVKKDKNALEKMLRGLTEGAVEAKRMREYVILPFNGDERRFINEWLKAENRKLYETVRPART